MVHRRPRQCFQIWRGRARRHPCLVLHEARAGPARGATDAHDESRCHSYHGPGARCSQRRHVLVQLLDQTHPPIPPPSFPLSYPAVVLYRYCLLCFAALCSVGPVVLSTVLPLPLLTFSAGASTAPRSAGRVQALYTLSCQAVLCKTPSSTVHIPVLIYAFIHLLFHLCISAIQSVESCDL